MNRDEILKRATNDEEKNLLSNLYDKYVKSTEKGYNTYSKFLNLKEQELSSRCFNSIEYYGGYEEAERKISAFLLNDRNYPITTLEVVGKDLKNLSHRDVLGALMGLGIKREMIGDIIVDEKIIIFSCTEISDYIINNLDKIGNKNVSVKEFSGNEIKYEKKFEEKRFTLASLRIDNFIKGVYNLSRNDAVKLISSYKVMVNQKPVTDNDFKVKPKDVVSVRGYGKCEFYDEYGVSKKGKNVIEIKKYI